MPVTAAFRDYVLEQLAGFAPVSARAMFGGYGLYAAGVLFAVLDDDTLFLRTDEPGRARFAARGARPFAPIPGAKPMLGYWEAPADVLEDRDELAAWSSEAQRVALAAKARKAGGTTPPRPRKRTAAKRSPRR